MKTYSSSTIKIFNDHCPRALEFYEDGEPYDTSQMDYGVASHAVIEAVGKNKNNGGLLPGLVKRIADKVCEELITNGRTFRGHHEPPMKPDHAFYGQDVALQYLEANELPDNARYEIQFETILGENEFKLVSLHDMVWEEDWSDEYGEKRVVVSRDWKGWQGTEDELDTVQRKAQALTLYDSMEFSDFDEIRLEVCNLHTHRVFFKSITLDDEGNELLEKWRRNLYLICKAIDKTRKARPGAGCLSCPYSYTCNSRFIQKPKKQEEYEDWALCLMYMETQKQEITKLLKASQELPAKIPGGYVGWKTWPDNKVSKELDNAFIVEEWYGYDGLDLVTTEKVSGLLKALELGVSNIKALAKVMYGKEDDAMKQDFLDKCLEKRKTRRFGIWRNKGND